MIVSWLVAAHAPAGRRATSDRAAPLAEQGPGGVRVLGRQRRTAAEGHRAGHAGQVGQPDALDRLLDDETLAGLDEPVVVALGIGVTQRRGVGTQPARGAVSLGRVRRVGARGRRVRTHAARPEDRPQRGVVVVVRSGRAAHRDGLLEDRVAHVEHRRVVGGQPHPAGDQRQRGAAADAAADVPQRLRPYLAAVVRRHVVGHGDVAVRVAAQDRARAAVAVAARDARRVDGAVDRLGPNPARAERVFADRQVRPGGVGARAFGDEQVEGVEVAPRLAHHARLDRRDRRAAGGIDDEPVAQPVPVLVVDDAGIVAAVDVEPVEEVHLHLRRQAVGWRAEVGVVDPRAVVDLRLDVVAAGALPARVRALEVARRLVEADRRLSEVVVEAAGQHVDVDRGLLLVGLRGRRRVAVPRAAGRRARRRTPEDRHRVEDPVGASRRAGGNLTAGAAVFHARRRGRGVCRWIDVGARELTPQPRPTRAVVIPGRRHRDLLRRRVHRIARDVFRLAGVAREVLAALQRTVGGVYETS